MKLLMKGLILVIINNDRVSDLKAYEEKFEVDGFEFYLNGFIYIDGCSPGMASLKKFAEMLRVQSLREAISRLKGNYFLYVVDQQAQRQFAFIDNSGMYESFYSSNHISTSFLDLVRYEHFTSNDLDKYAVVEFLNLGGTHFDRTILATVKKFTADDLMTFDNGVVTGLKKNRTHIEEASDYQNIIDYFEAFAPQLKDRNISVDLTGGIDSRLIFTILDYFGLPFEASVTGEKEDTDIKIAETVSRQTEHQLYRTERPSSLDEPSIHEAFYYGDGLFDVLRLYSARQAHQDRLGRGIDLVINGAGGELYKDFWWMQDFPFYRRKASNIKRLLDTRILPIQMPGEYLTEDYRQRHASFKNELLEELMVYQSEINTETYDKIHYYFNLQNNAGRIITSANQYFDVYSPLLELENIRMTHHLPKMTRFHNHFHREVITKVNPSIAKIKTTEGGMTVSSKPHYQIRDNILYVADRGKRLSKKVGQKVFKKTFFGEKYHRNHFFEHLRQLETVHHSIDVLKEEGILHPDVVLENIPDASLGKLMSLGMIINYINKNESFISYFNKR
ncbi:hypothetical protein [Tuberibacillus sp. Marseille-P3662]|uniref:hypothetical protein n=1 Tax=Tuberibacillus sp. Marseille-P3662 TaxID=1965358 RepID=UPI000A1CAEE8|nr:hypothetical protein [Tuberibacillus sp. Marseille-P3662]